MAEIIDASYPIGGSAGYLAGAGVDTVIRYYSRDTGNPAKRLTRSEAEQFANAGLSIVVVHEARHGDKASAFCHELGVLDAQYVLDYARAHIRQPSGSAVYFGVDFDANPQELSGLIVPYFQGVASIFEAANAALHLLIGVYGSGLTCKELQDAGLVDMTWLAQSTGWAGYQAYEQSNAWTMRQLMPAKVGDVKCDPDIANPDGREIGAFTIVANAPDGALATLGRRRVIAGPGLRLRAGPGTDFDITGMVPLNTVVTAMKVVGDWTMADTDGDGAADGFLNSHYLVEVT